MHFRLQARAHQILTIILLRIRPVYEGYFDLRQRDLHHFERILCIVCPVTFVALELSQYFLFDYAPLLHAGIIQHLKSCHF